MFVQLDLINYMPGEFSYARAFNYDRMNGFKELIPSQDTTCAHRRYIGNFQEPLERSLVPMLQPSADVWRIHLDAGEYTKDMQNKNAAAAVIVSSIEDLNRQVDNFYDEMRRFCAVLNISGTPHYNFVTAPGVPSIIASSMNSANIYFELIVTFGTQLDRYTAQALNTGCMYINGYFLNGAILSSRVTPWKDQV